MALDGIAVIVNASKVEDLTVEQIAQVFTGEIADWSEAGRRRLAPLPVSAARAAPAPGRL